MMRVKHWKLFTGRRPVRFALFIALGIGFGMFWGWYALYAPPKRFDVVQPGELYRSGSLTPRTLEQVTQRHGIRTVLSMLNPEAPESVAERAAAERLGLHWINVPLRGNGASEPADREIIRQVMLDKSNRPLLVHCAAGVNRTGLAVGMYRIHEQGWTYDQVLEELRAKDFDDLEKHENLRSALRDEAERPATTERLSD